MDAGCTPTRSTVTPIGEITTQKRQDDNLFKFADVIAIRH
jgi:hypothetical protein